MLRQCLVKEEDPKMYIRYEHNYINQAKAIEEDAWRKIHSNAIKENEPEKKLIFPVYLALFFKNIL